MLHHNQKATISYSSQMMPCPGFIRVNSTRLVSLGRDKTLLGHEAQEQRAQKPKLRENPGVIFQEILVLSDVAAEFSDVAARLKRQGRAQKTTCNQFFCTGKRLAPNIPDTNWVNEEENQQLQRVPCYAPLEHPLEHHWRTPSWASFRQPRIKDLWDQQGLRQTPQQGQTGCQQCIGQCQ